jgi:hypothetical protein
MWVDRDGSSRSGSCAGGVRRLHERRRVGSLAALTLARPARARARVLGRSVRLPRRCCGVAPLPPGDLGVAAPRSLRAFRLARAPPPCRRASCASRTRRSTRSPRCRPRSGSSRSRSSSTAAGAAASVRSESARSSTGSPRMTRTRTSHCCSRCCAMRAGIRGGNGIASLAPRSQGRIEWHLQVEVRYGLGKLGVVRRRIADELRDGLAFGHKR